MTKKQEPPVTIFEVAERAGVSIGTVSRVINNRNRVSPKTRQRVLEAMRALNYQPNGLAQRLASQQTKMIGLVLTQVNDPFYYPIVRGVEDVVSAADYTLLIMSHPPQRNEHSLKRPLWQSMVDGLIWVAVSLDVKEMLSIINSGVLVSLVQQELSGSASSVLTDNYNGMVALARHLVETHGYQRFAYITGTNYTADSSERLRALRDVLAQHALSLPSENIVTGDYLRGSGAYAMHKLLALPERPQVVVAANDQMAADAILAAREHGLRVPEDIAVTGFDDVLLAQYTSPALTTVHQPIYEMGAQAARLVLDGLRARQEGREWLPLKVVLPTTLVIRQSCGCRLEEVQPAKGGDV